MNWDQVEGNWKQMTGAVAKKWGKLTGDDLAIARGHRDVLTGKLQERYGLAKEAAQNELDHFVRDFKASENGSVEVATEGAPVDMKTLKIGM